MRDPKPLLRMTLAVAMIAWLPAQAADSNAQADEQDPCPRTAASEAKAKTPAAEATEPVCTQCGTIVRIESRTKEGEGTGLGMATGAVLGAVAGREIVSGSRGSRNTAAAVGAIGGGYAGHKIEESARTENYYLVSVEMDADSRIEVVRIESIEGWASGDKVRIVNGELLRQ